MELEDTFKSLDQQIAETLQANPDQPKTKIKVQVKEVEKHIEDIVNQIEAIFEE